MKIFALLAILFFAFRAFSQNFNYFYVDEYIRAQEDKDYQAYLVQKEKDKKFFRQGVEDYKDQKDYDEQMQEVARQNYSEWKRTVPQKNFEKYELDHEKKKQKEEEKFLAIQKKYAYEKSLNPQISPNFLERNSRAIASLEERKFIPKKDRKFKFKNPKKN